jgi:hypothetical protein
MAGHHRKEHQVAYQYRGTTTVEEEPATDYGCGTYAGYRRHKRNTTTPCDDCQEAARAYWRDYDEARKTAPKRIYGFNPDRCGTYAGWARHRQHKTPVCEPCRLATNQYMADYRARKATA